MTMLKAPFPYFGGKSRIAPLVWQRFGRVQNYVEPFFGSGAVLLGCPHPGHTETVNDADALLANFWRALQSDPDGVARYAEWPVNECDLHARHRWLVARRSMAEELMADPDAYDIKMAGWWVWGISQWIGSGWCPPARAASLQMPHLGDAGQGLHRLSQQLPHVGDAGSGGRRARGAAVDGDLWQQKPQLSDGRKGGFNTDATSGEALRAYLQSLAARLRRVRVCCGDWSRIMGDSVTWRHGLTAVFLDPPYDRRERADLYAVESDVSDDVRAWAVANGDNPLLRIALCGYDDRPMPEGWEIVRWKAPGGYGSQGDGRGRVNAARECIWFSPHCINKTPLELLLEETL